ncbi:MAG: 16S rRNA (cytidine(1402)-2'-O)-methyltransferase [Proteobacteria bacterium]|nr:16S rRNA (cytidine(1402)-2'-O)-methyltransferase [Pseudomonadota bacterium]NQW44789.1 16S rRNA (cytidine(1402)-2'-O)-methyltransferase [Deltaproteobacteria bacterium]
MTCKLYIIATPLGNLGDITLRAIEIFKTVDTFFAEDSREFHRLLMALNIPNQGKRVFSYASHNLKEATDQAIGILLEGRSVGLVTDRGTPAISDPGSRLVKRAHEEKIPVIPIPGASSVTTLISVSGMETTSFEFAGFLPTQDKQRNQLWESIARKNIPFVFFESPKRISDTVLELKKQFPQGELFIGREMTKKFEEYRWFSLADIPLDFMPQLGEFAVILVPGNKVVAEDWEKEIALRVASDKEWAKEISKRFGMTSSEIYNALQKIKSK